MHRTLPQVRFRLFEWRREVASEAKVTDLQDRRIAAIQQGVVEFEIPTREGL